MLDFNCSVDSFDFREFMKNLKERHVGEIKLENSKELIRNEIRDYFLDAVKAGVIEKDFAESVERFVQENLYIN